MNEVITIDLLDIKKKIKEELESLADGCIAIGYYLKQARDKELFKEDGYENIFEFAKEEFSLGRSSVYTYMAINDKFSVDGNSLQIETDFRGYGSSKLAEMITFNEEQLQVITPDATVKDIRDYKKISNEIEEENKSPDVWTNGENTKDEGIFGLSENSLCNFVDNYFKKDGKPIFEKVISTVLSTNSDREEKIMYAFAPSKFKNIQIKGGTAIFNDKCIHILMIGKGKNQYSYSDLLKALEQVFHPEEGKTAAELYERYYNEPLLEPEKPKEVVKPKAEPVKTKVEIKDAQQEPEEQLPGQAYIDDYPEVQPDGGSEDEETIEENEESLENAEEDTEEGEEITTNQLVQEENTTEPLESTGAAEQEVHTEEDHFEAEIVQTEDIEEHGPASEQSEIEEAIEYFKTQNSRLENIMGEKVEEEPVYKYTKLAIIALEKEVM